MHAGMFSSLPVGVHQWVWQKDGRWHTRRRRCILRGQASDALPQCLKCPCQLLHVGSLAWPQVQHVKHRCQWLECHLAHVCQARDPAQKVASPGSRAILNSADQLTRKSCWIEQSGMHSFPDHSHRSSLHFKMVMWSHHSMQPMTITPKHGDDASRDSGAMRFSKQ